MEFTGYQIKRWIADAEELKQGAKRLLVKGLLLDHDFFEIVADSQNAIEEYKRLLG